jgi:hypothetical protein
VLCQTSIVYGRKLGETTYSFGHEGILYRQSFIMYDKETDSKWVHTTGEAVQGPCKGKVLTFLPSTVTSWKKWKALHPKTTVLLGRKANTFMGSFNFKKEPKKYGLSLGQGVGPKLYPFAGLMEDRVVNDEHDGRKVLVVYDDASGTARAFDRGEHSFRSKDGGLLDEKGRTWDLLQGQLQGGKERLAPLPATTWLLKRWRGFHPKGAVYKAAR